MGGQPEITMIMMMITMMIRMMIMLMMVMMIMVMMMMMTMTMMLTWVDMVRSVVTPRETRAGMAFWSSQKLT